MKIVFGVILLFGFAFCESNIAIRDEQIDNSDHNNYGPLDININLIVDKFLDDIGIFLQQNGLDPLDLPDVKTGFEIRPLLITYHGELTLTRGYLQDLRTIYRAGDATCRPILQKWRVKLPIGFTRIEFAYDYKAKFMHVGPKGGIVGHLDGLEIYVEVMANAVKRTLDLIDFQVTDMGKIKVKFTGNPLTDFWASAFADVVTSICHGIIVDVVESSVKAVLNSTFDQINNKSWDKFEQVQLQIENEINKSGYN